MIGHIIYKLDGWSHRLGFHFKPLCRLLDISCGMDRSAWNMPGTPEYPVLNEMPETWLYLTANWWFNSRSRRRHPIHWWRHDRGIHRWGEAWKYEKRIPVKRWRICLLCDARQDLPLNLK